jgi:hypothetical protein
MSRLPNVIRLAGPERGLDGRSVLSKARAPLMTDGRIGDFWIDSVTKKLYGPKSAASWPDNGLIRGAAGWYPLLRVASDGARRVLEIYDHAGGEGTKPSTGYLTAAGTLTATIGSGADIRGATGPGIGPDDFADQATAEAATVDDEAMSPLTTKQARVFAGFRSIMDEGAVGNGIADDTDAVEAAVASGDPTFLPPGIYDTTISQGALTGVFQGRGQVRDSDGNKRGPYFSVVSEEPTRGDESSFLTMFNGDLSKVQFAIEHRVTGTDTLGQPDTGYLYTPEASPEFTAMFVSSGHNEATDSNDGRTTVAAKHVHMTHTGQGDIHGYIMNGVVSGTKAGSTNFLANPAITFSAGAFFGGANGVMLNVSEHQLIDQGFDVAGIGPHTVLERNNATGAKTAVWLANLISSRGAVAIDAMFIGKGKTKVGLDLAGAIFESSKIAISLPANGRIYGNALHSASGNTEAGWYTTAPGTEWLEYNSSNSAWQFYVGNAVSLFIFGNQILANSIPFNANGASNSYRVNGTDVVKARKTGWSVATGTATRTAFATSTVTLSELAERVKALIDDLHGTAGHGLIGT